MNRVLIAGAGAEVDLGFRSGSSFTQDTFYRQKVSLYNALDTFYEGRLSSSCAGSVPSSYEAAFLFNSKGAAFKRLIANLVKDDPGFIVKTLGKSLDAVEDESSYTSDDYKVLFNKLIAETDDSDSSHRHGAVLKAIPKDVHFGTLEQYYSELLNPQGHKRRFWKLVNFYWSAFFSIALPITDGLYGGNDEYNGNRYSYVLSNLDDAIHEIFNDSEVLRKTSECCYYSALRGKFSKVITTNYTPYAASVVDCDNSSIAWLGGRLSQFEHLPELEFVDYSDKGRHLEAGKFVFPYLLCQSPVKPIISLSQIDEYVKATNALRSADEIVVLGYSFCDEDAHICSMVGESLREDSKRKLVFFAHTDKCSDDFDKEEEVVELGRRLRVGDLAAKKQIEVLPICDYNSDAFVDRCKSWM